jgi:putative sporulation protein YtxC
MGTTISIGTSREIDFLQKRLVKEAGVNNRLGFKVVPHFWECGLFRFLDCEMVSPAPEAEPELNSRFRLFLAGLVSETIIEEWEKPMVRSIIKHQHGHFSLRDKELILLKVERSLDHADQSLSPSGTISSRKGKILKETLEFLKDSNQLIIDGLVKFRLQDYSIQLREAVEAAVEEYQLEKEYQEFIRLLQYFVEIQEPRVSQAHVMIHSGGTFRIFDAKGNPVGSDYEEGFLLDVMDNDINYEDLLISTLITIAPSRIVIHTSEYSKLNGAISTIERVFGKRVATCRGCEECRRLNPPQGN